MMTSVAIFAGLLTACSPGPARFAGIQWIGGQAVVRIFRCEGSPIDGLALGDKRADEAKSSTASVKGGSWEVSAPLDGKLPSMVPLFSTPAGWNRIGFGLDHLEPGKTYNLDAFFTTRGTLVIQFTLSELKRLRKNQVLSYHPGLLGRTGDSRRMTLAEFVHQAKNDC